MTEKELRKIHKDIQEIIETTVPAFFCKKGEKLEISTRDYFHELKVTISDSIGLYFYKLLKKL